MREALIDSGVSEEHVLTAPPSFDSTTNLEAIKAMARQKNWQSVAVVSAPLHLLRVRYAGHDLHDLGSIRLTFHAYDPDTIPSQRRVW